MIVHFYFSPQPQATRQYDFSKLLRFCCHAITFLTDCVVGQEWNNDAFMFCSFFLLIKVCFPLWLNVSVGGWINSTSLRPFINFFNFKFGFWKSGNALHNEICCCLIKLHQFFRDFGLGGSFQKESGFSAHYQLPIILVSEGPEQKKSALLSFKLSFYFHHLVFSAQY